MKGKNINYLCNDSLSSYEKFLHAFTFPVSYALFQRGDFMLHGSAIEINGKGYIFIGPTGSGKSTTVALLGNMGKIISEDILRITFENGRAYIYPSFPIIKVDHKLISDLSFEWSNKFELVLDDRNRIGIHHQHLTEFEKIEVFQCFVINEGKKEAIAELENTECFKHVLFNSICPLPRRKCLYSEKKLYTNIQSFLGSVNVMKYTRNKDYSFNTLKKKIEEICEI